MSSQTRSSLIGNQPRMLDAVSIAESLNFFFPSLHVTAGDINKPTPERMTSIYQHITQKIMDLSMSTQVLPLNSVEDCSNPDIFRSVFPKIITVNALSAVIEDITEGGQEFTVANLVSPDPRSSRLFLSHLINFLQFSEEANKEVFRVFAQHDEKKLELQERERDILAKENDVEKIRNEMKNRKREENKKREELEHLVGQLQKMSAESEKQRIACEEAKASSEEMDKRKKELEDEHRSLCVHKKMLSSKIVSSPERIQSELKNLMQQTKVLQGNLDMKRRELAEMMEKHRARAQIAKELQQVSAEVASMSHFQKDIADKENALQEIEERRRIAANDLNKVNEEIGRELEAASERNAAFVLSAEHHAQKMRDLDEQLQATYSQSENVRVRVKNMGKENMEIMREASRVKDELAALNRTAQAEASKLSTRLTEIHKQLEDERAAYREESEVLARIIQIVREGLTGNPEERSETLSSTSSQKLEDDD